MDNARHLGLSILGGLVVALIWGAIIAFAFTAIGLLVAGFITLCTALHVSMNAVSIGVAILMLLVLVGFVIAGVVHCILMVHRWGFKRVVKSLFNDDILY